MGRLGRTDKQKRKGRNLGRRIKVSREDSSYTQESLAKAAGISLDTLRKIEGGTVASPNVFLIAKLAQVLRKDIRKWLK